MRITIQSHPALWRAIELIHLDNGERFDKQFVELNGTAKELASIDYDLALLRQDDFDNFILGEAEEQNRVAKCLPSLTKANVILNEYFDTL